MAWCAEVAIADRTSVDVERDGGLPAQASGVGELGAHLTGAGSHRLGSTNEGPGETEQVVAVGRPPLEQIEAHPPKAPPWAMSTPVGCPFRHLDVSRDRVGGVLRVDHRTLTEPGHAPVEKLRASGDQLGPAGQLGQEAFHPAIVEWEGPVLDRLDEEQPLEVVELLGMFGGQVRAWDQSVVVS